MIQKPDFRRALLAGLVGWVAMNIFLAMAPMMGVRMNVPQMLGGMFGMNSLALGWSLHLMIGLVLGLIYAYWLASRLPGAPWLRGMLFGILPWLFMMVLLAPMMPMMNPMTAKMPPGFFLANLGMMATVGSLVAHLVYGVVLGAVYGKVAVAAQSAQG